MNSLRVVKLGGSLLDVANLKSRFLSWLSVQPPARNLVVVGGGRFVEALRDADRRHGLGGETSHWLAVRAMGLTARLLAAILRDVPLLTRPEECGRLAILDPWDFLQAAESAARPPPLPHSWDVTSDSIAARVAVTLRAQELVLLKSALPPSEDVQAAAQAEYVDRFFPNGAKRLNVRCVQLTGEGFPQRCLRWPE